MSETASCRWLNMRFTILSCLVALITECLSRFRLNCSHHCVVRDKGGAACRCPLDQALRSDNVTCYPLGESLLRLFSCFFLISFLRLRVSIFYIIWLLPHDVHDSSIFHLLVMPTHSKVRYSERERNVVKNKGNGIGLFQVSFESMFVLRKEKLLAE